MKANVQFTFRDLEPGAEILTYIALFHCQDANRSDSCCAEMREKVQVSRPREEFAPGLGFGEQNAFSSMFSS